MTKPARMTEEKQRIAIAEACGWKANANNPKFYRLNEGPIRHWSALPDYLNDLNAMHEAEKVLSVDGVRSFNRELTSIVSNTKAARLSRGESNAVCYEWHATAAQRAEALLRTLNLWRDA